ncbi:MAG TPA: DUF4864 domain-containing protein [Bauldia sp.]|nr:DUF4864 domain-containing protein [Bauldia sp.]
MNAILRFLSAVAVILSLGGLARAGDVAAADQEAFKSIIASQLDAFQHDDGAAAYSYASPTIKGIFPSPEQFMAMVRNAYQPVYRPQSVTFGPVADTPVGPTMKVFLTGPDGKSYVALYTMQRQPDGTWKINGCVLLEDNSPTI